MFLPYRYIDTGDTDMPIEWRETMSIDHGPIDEDHKVLVKIINDFEEILISGFNHDRIMDNLNKLEYYTVYHFVREETLQRVIGWKDCERHADEHKKIIGNVKKAIYLFEKGIPEDKRDRFTENMLRLFRVWIVDHIIQFDVPMRSAVQAYRKGPLTTI